MSVDEDQLLIFSVTATDPDGDNITLWYSWYKDGSLNATTLIEYGLDFIPYENVPVVLCDKLQKYYRILSHRNRPKLDDDCNKIYDL